MSGSLGSDWWAGGQPRSQRHGRDHLVSRAEVPGQGLSTYLATCSAHRARSAEGRSLGSGGAQANVQIHGEGKWGTPPIKLEF